MKPPSEAVHGLDVPTIIAISALGYAIANVVHEGLGHGGACLLVGARPTMFNAIFFNYDESTTSDFGRRVIAAAGSTVNVAVALPLLALIRGPARLSPRWRYFVWLFCAVNLLTAFGYLAYSGVLGIGDWALVIAGAKPALVFRLILVALGGWLYFRIGPRLLRPLLDPFLGRDPAVREARARRLSLLPYLAGSLALVAAGLLNPLGFQIVLISAVAAGFGGTSLLAWYFTIPRTPVPSTGEPPLDIGRSTAWIAAAAIGMVVFVFVLGRGIGKV